jgi:hypothetical protein
MKNRETQYLEFNNLGRLHRLNRLLVPYLASRYRVLPVAEDGARVTVAMADPDDKEAREAMLAALGPSVYVVRADVQVIDSLLEKFWKNANNRSLELALWVPNKSNSTEVENYANCLAALLGAHLNQIEIPNTGKEACKEPTTRVEHTAGGAVGVEMLEKANLERLTDRPPVGKLADQLTTSLLVVRQPRWPIKSFLLILRNGASDATAVEWTIHLARSSGATVTVLPLSIPIPTNYNQNSPKRCSIDTILTSKTELGQKTRLVAQLLANSEINGTLRLRQEPPTWQIRFELLENDYDLVVIDRKPSNKLWDWILGELVNPLLSWTDRPLLITR